MPIRLWQCENAACTVAFFRRRDNEDGTCPRCGEQATRVIWAVR